jgi:uncharacterized protein YndB with AHSA1/START domain
MGHAFEQRREAELPASPEEVWEAIATGPGTDSWFMGHSEIKAGLGGTVRTVFGEHEADLDVTAWDPPGRFGYASGRAPDGRFIAYEFLIEGRGGGTTVLRTVTSGFLPGDDWEDEYDAMTKGGELYFRTLVEYLTYFAGRIATPITVFGPAAAGWDRALARLCGEFGLSSQAATGDRVRCTLDGLPSIDGVVYFVNAHALGIRTADALYRFIRGFGKPAIAAHELFGDGVDPGRAAGAWRAWLDALLA